MLWLKLLSVVVVVLASSAVVALLATAHGRGRISQGPASSLTSPPPRATASTPAHFTDHLQWSQELPISVYGYSSADIADEQAALNKLTAECMRTFGYRWTGASVTLDALVVMDSRRYGVTSLMDAAAYGYALPPAAAPNRNTVLPTTEETVLAGLPARPGDDRTNQLVVHGRTVPAGGCSGEAYAGVGDKVRTADPAGLIKSRSFKQSLTDARVEAAFRAWSQCMGKSGYRYPDPLASAGDPRWPVRPSSHERQVAVADVTCARTVRLDQIWLGVEVELERPLIAQSLPDLDKERAARDRLRTDLSAILAR